MSEQFGDTLSPYPNLDVLVGDSADALKALLLQIRLPHKIHFIYSQGTRHYAWVTTERPLNKKVKPTKEKKDGSSKG